MPIRINLYHEVLRAKKQEQYDPLRLSLYVMIVIVAGMAGYYFLELSKTSAITKAYRQKQAEFDKLKPQEAAAKAKEEGLTKLITQAEHFSKRIEERFYWAPVFEQLTASVPANVQLTKFTGDISNEASRRCQMLIEGLAAGEEPRRVAEDLRIAMNERLGAKFKGVSATFKSLEDGSERVSVDGKKVPTVLFSIALSFPTKSVEPAPAPAPAKQIARKQ